MSESFETACKAVLMALSALLFTLGSANLFAGVALMTVKSEALQFINQLGGARRKDQIDAVTSHSGLVAYAAYALCAVGGITLLAGCCGFYGAFLENPTVLYAYAILLCMFIGMQLLLIIIVTLFRTNVESEASSALRSLQDKYYVSMSSYLGRPNSTSKKIVTTRLINTIQVMLECCGANKVGDIAQSGSWNASDLIWYNQQLVRPLTCCKLSNAKKKQIVLRPTFDTQLWTDYLLEPDCPFILETAPGAVHNTTCSIAIINFAMEYFTYAMVACITIVCAEISGVIAAYFMISFIEEYDDDDDDYDL